VSPVKGGIERRRPGQNPVSGNPGQKVDAVPVLVV